MACLDTTVLLDLMGRGDRRGFFRAGGAVESLRAAGERVVTTRFNAAELYIGVERAQRPEREASRVQAIFRGLPILDFDDSAARLFARSVAHLQRLGRPAGDMDVLIASVAMAHGHALLTRNTRHFSDIPDLVVHGY